MEYLIAEALGMTVAALRAEMSNDEYVRWAVWFARKAQTQQLALRGRYG